MIRMSGFENINDIIKGQYDGDQVTLRGWIYNKRSSGGIQFINIRDGSGVIQCTLNKKRIGAETFDIVDGLPLESTIQLEGIVNEDSRAPEGREVQVIRITEYNAAMQDYPIVKKEHGLKRGVS